MTCVQCHDPNAFPGGYCSRCGMRQPATTAAPYPTYTVPYIPRVQQHLRSLGMLWMVFAAYRVVSVFLGLAFANVFLHSRFFGWNRMGRDFPFPFLHAIMPVVFGMTIVMAAAAAITGWGLLNRKRWARVLAIVFGVMALLKFPLGTALGIYTLWVLAPAASGAEYDQIAVD